MNFRQLQATPALHHPQGQSRFEIVAVRQHCSGKATLALEVMIVTGVGASEIGEAESRSLMRSAPISKVALEISAWLEI